MINFVTVKGFSQALGVNGVTVRQRILRGKLIKNDYGFIDVKDPINYSYIVECNGGNLSVFETHYIVADSLANVNKKVYKQRKNLNNNNLGRKKVLKPVEKVVLEKKVENKEVNGSNGSVTVEHTLETKNIEVKKVVPKLTLEEKKQLESENLARKSYLALDLRKKEAEVSLVERNAELKQYELEKKAGNTLPLDITTKIIVINTQTILNKFLLECENMVSLVVEEFGGTRADNVRITNKLKTAFTKIVDIARTETNNKIENSITEYSEVRSRGERK